MTGFYGNHKNTPYQKYGVLWSIYGTDCHTSDIGHWFAMTSIYGKYNKYPVPKYGVYCVRVTYLPG